MLPLPTAVLPVQVAGLIYYIDMQASGSLGVVSTSTVRTPASAALPM